MKKYKVYQVDSFTKSKFKGNPAGVVTNAEGLTPDQMLEIAAELKNSETAFIFPPEADDHVVRIRFFTPAIEVPSCGHATVASHYVRALESNSDSKTVIHKIGAGILPVDIIKEKNDYKIMMTQKRPEFQNIIEGDLKENILKALGLNKNEIYDYPVQVVDTGHSKVMIGIKSRDKLNSLNPDFISLKNYSREINCNGYYVFTLDSDDPEFFIHGRMFAPAIGINEDPVTGNANGPLGAYLIKYNIVKHDGKFFSFKGRQGEAMGRPGEIFVEVFIENNEPVKVKIGGYAVVAFQTEIEI